MNKVLILTLILIFNFISSEKMFLLHKKEVLLANNVDDVYGTGVQQELVRKNKLLKLFKACNFRI